MEEEKFREVGPLVQVTFTLGVAAENAETRRSETFPRKLIVGLAASGMTPFENLLMGRRAGEMVSTAVARSELANFFGPLPVTLPPLPDDSDPLKIFVDIREVEKPEGREMIRAMAAQVQECGGGCGCGCGGH